MLVNGEKKDIQNGMPLLDYLKNEGYNPERVAVEHNGDIVPKNKYQEELLYQEDTIEIVHFVGGG